MKLAVPLLLVACLAIVQAAQHSDQWQGLKAAGLSHEEVLEHLDATDPERRVHDGHLKQDELETHPDVHDFLEWKKAVKDQPAGSATAFSGKIPPELLYSVLHHEFKPQEL